MTNPLVLNLSRLILYNSLSASIHGNAEAIISIAPKTFVAIILVKIHFLTSSECQTFTSELIITSF